MQQAAPAEDAEDPAGAEPVAEPSGQQQEPAEGERCCARPVVRAQEMAGTALAGEVWEKPRSARMDGGATFTML